MRTGHEAIQVSQIFMNVYICSIKMWKFRLKDTRLQEKLQYKS